MKSNYEYIKEFTIMASIVNILLLILLIFTFMISDAESATIPFNKPVTAFNLIVDAEGYHPTIYIDTTGNETCGYGFKVQTHPDICKVESQYRHDAYLNEILPSYIRMAENFHWDANLQVNAVLTDLVYNIGYKLYTFKNMRKALKVGDYMLAASELRDSKYCRQTKTRCERNALILEGVN